jgi:hypothetical protein
VIPLSNNQRPCRMHRAFEDPAPPDAQSARPMRRAPSDASGAPPDAGSKPVIQITLLVGEEQRTSNESATPRTGTP